MDETDETRDAQEKCGVRRGESVAQVRLRSPSLGAARVAAGFGLRYDARRIFRNSNLKFWVKTQ
jgi:hypothetical protein